jgi:alkylation response protein AidB-like acyl-CoA dehydrogenase
MQITGLGTITVINNASEELKKKYLPIVARGEKMASYGRNRAGHRLRLPPEFNAGPARRGAGMLSTAGSGIPVLPINHLYHFICLTDSEKDNAGISAFLFPTDTPGYRVVIECPVLGCADTGKRNWSLRECWIPEKNLMVKKAKAELRLRSLDQTRTTLNAGFIGLARACLEEAVKYAKARKTFGKELFHRQALSFPLAAIAARIDAARLMNYEAAWLHDQGRRHTVETAKAKLLATHVMLEAADMAIEVYGGFGCTTREIVERFYRDAKIWSFAQGSPQIMDYIISRGPFRKYEM